MAEPFTFGNLIRKSELKSKQRKTHDTALDLGNRADILKSTIYTKKEGKGG
jgi:hypothetical protein